MRRYLKEFLSDRRVIEVNPVVWWFILNGPVLTKRPFSVGRGLPLDLEQRARRVSLAHDHAQPG